MPRSDHIGLSLCLSLPSPHASTCGMGIMHTLLTQRVPDNPPRAASVKAVVRDLGKTKNGKQKAAKEARKIVEMKGKQIKDELSLAMIQLFTKLLDEDSVEASTIDDVIQGPN